MTTTMPGVRPAVPHFSSGPCAKRPGWSLEALKDAAARPLAPRQARQGPAQGRHRPHPRRPRRSRRLPHRHRARLRHRRRRDGACGRCSAPARSTCWPGRASARAGSPTSSSSSSSTTPASSRPPTASSPTSPAVDSDADVVLHLERHHLRRARAERRLDRRRPRGPHHLRRDLGGLRAGPRLGQARCRHLLLAEGAGRRGGARHADPLAARGRAARELHARLAAAEDLPPDHGRQADRGHLRGRDHQHALDARRRGRHRRAGLGEGGRRPRRA